MSDDIPDLSDQCNVGDIQAPSAAKLREYIEKRRNPDYKPMPTHEAKMLVSLELLHKLLELPDNVQITAVSTKMINRVPTMALHLEGPAHLLEHGSWVKAVYSHKPKFDSFQKEEPPIPDPFQKDCNADPVNGGCDCCNRTGMVQEGMISMPCHCLEGLR